MIGHPPFFRLAARVTTEPWPAFDAPGLRVEVIVDRMIGAPGGTLDFTGQYALDTRYPVGVVTGVLGAPYLVYLIVRTNRAGGSL